MKRDLFDSVSVVPAAAEKVVDREGFLSAVFAANMGTYTGEPTGATFDILVEHCDIKNGTFEAVADAKLVPSATTTGGKIEVGSVSSGAGVQISLDLLGCKRYIKITPTITFTGGTSPAANDAAYVLVLGDPIQAPVEV